MKGIIAILVLCAVAHMGYAMSKVCQAKLGKKVVTFGKTTEIPAMSCKYNAVRRTRCGDWLVTVTPGNELESMKNRYYVIKSMWIGLENLTTTLKWEGRTSLKIARKYLDNLKEEPVNRKDGFLKTSDVFNFGPRTADNEISLMEKSGAFKITYGLYSPDDDKHKSSGFKFECFHEDFHPEPYPRQLCGNGTSSEVKKFKKMMEWKDNRLATLFFHIFTNDELIQTDSDCLTAQRTMTNKCGDQEKQYMAAKLCYPIFAKKRYQRCISGNMDDPKSAFRHCVEYVCSDFQDKNACKALSTELDMCPELKTVSMKVRSHCAKDFFAN